MMKRLLMSIVCCSVVLSACSRLTIAQTANSRLDIPTPASVIGHEVGEDYKLARWETIVDYFNRLGDASNRVNVRRIGTSTENNPYLLVEISSADTIANLDRYRTLQSKLADPRKINDEADRQKLLKEAKTTIVVTAALHSSECAGSQMAMELAYKLASANDPLTREILDNCIILLVPSANPDGNNKIIDWYEKYVGTQYEGGWMPWLYQKYAGHDNNRDWFMLNLKETRILTEILYHEWYPTISYDIHQMGNRGARFFVPPFYDPINPNVDPLIHQSLLLIGGHMATELQENGMTGVVYRAIFDNWWQGGNRTTPYRHNVVGILTEAASAKMASPIFQTHRDLRGGGRGFPNHDPAVNFPEPWAGGWWRLRDIVDYELTASKALFTLAARYRDRFVRNHLSLSEKALRLGSDEPPFAWLVPPDQRDPGAAAHMLEILRLSGIEVHQSTDSFIADGRSYPAGTYVLLAKQPYRPHLKDMMERQILPDRKKYEGGPPEAPYDSAGWTLPVQMGVKSVEVVSHFDAPLQRVHQVASTKITPPTTQNGAYITRRWGNADYAAINRLLDDGFDISVLKESFDGYPTGSVIVSSQDRSSDINRNIKKITQEIPARFDRLENLPDQKLLQKMTRPRTALYQPWTSSMDEGWTRLVLEQFEFPYTTIHNADIRAGNLRDRFDAIIIPSMSAKRLMNGASVKDMPPPYSGGIGKDGAMALERFVDQGGTLVLMDAATELATDVFRVPVRNTLKDLPKDAFMCPGSLLRLRVDQNHPLGYGFDNEASATFARSRAFVTGKDALQPSNKKDKTNKDEDNRISIRELTKQEIDAKVSAQQVTSAAHYADSLVLLSGWIYGDQHIRGRTAIAEVQSGQGHIVLLGFRVQFRGQPHNTFKFLFNAIYRSTLNTK